MLFLFFHSVILTSCHTLLCIWISTFLYSLWPSWHFLSFSFSLSPFLPSSFFPTKRRPRFTTASNLVSLSNTATLAESLSLSWPYVLLPKFGRVAVFGIAVLLRFFYTNVLGGIHCFLGPVFLLGCSDSFLMEYIPK